MDEKKHKDHFQNALSNYSGVLRIGDELDEKAGNHKDEIFPDDWEKDPLMLYGQYIGLLNLTEGEKEFWRRSTLEMIGEKGPYYIWENRFRLTAEIEFIRTF